VPDYTNTTGRTYCNASGSVRLNNDVLVVRKFKPSETSEDVQHAYAFGSANPQEHIRGRIVISAATASVSVVVWKNFVRANPTWRDELYEVVISYTEKDLGAASYNHKRCRIVKATPNESDGSTTGEPLMDLEILPLGVEHFGVTGSARP
jgi:hypothetical protein